MLKFPNASNSPLYGNLMLGGYDMTGDFQVCPSSTISVSQELSPEFFMMMISQPCIFGNWSAHHIGGDKILYHFCINLQEDLVDLFKRCRCLRKKLRFIRRFCLSLHPKNLRKSKTNQSDTEDPAEHNRPYPQNSNLRSTPSNLSYRSESPTDLSSSRGSSPTNSSIRSLSPTNLSEQSLHVDSAPKNLSELSLHVESAVEQ